MRVNAGRRADAGIAACERACQLCIIDVGRNGDETDEAGGPCALEDRIQIIGEALVGQVAM
jgi:hypothetical protein